MLAEPAPLWQTIRDTGRLRYLDGGAMGCMNESEKCQWIVAHQRAGRARLVLENLCSMHGSPLGKGVFISIRLTHSDLGRVRCTGCSCSDSGGEIVSKCNAVNRDAIDLERWSS